MFMVFILSYVISLFLSTTSVLMFLGILTSHYVEEDFHMSLLKNMIIGLSALFFSIATMMVAFYAELFIMLDKKSSISFIPLISLASLSTLFIFMHFPFLIEIYISTYRAHIFDNKVKSWL